MSYENKNIVESVGIEPTTEVQIDRSPEPAPTLPLSYETTKTGDGLPSEDMVHQHRNLLLPVYLGLTLA